ncbi:hypothetical protein AAJ76_900040770 [Vairimorpha ceranae]|uniref:Uncharacterized protein n=1 Tax=Vairimorpha ceranae TaxID=40302 RepID=A0A0F9ZEV0_9MICR|nr:hypothetical protein AAJ76_900040770 [Vairimorpha ceranae]KKO75924.1 hypothetical protein AAJ76_900040770 [Vairimorpha ceranae]
MKYKTIISLSVCELVAGHIKLLYYNEILKKFNHTKLCRLRKNLNLSMVEYLRYLITKYIIQRRPRKCSVKYKCIFRQKRKIFTLY